MAMLEDQGDLRRFVHWGPIVTLVVTLTVTLTTWMWWPRELNFMTRAHFALFLLLNLLAVYYYVQAVLTGPGFLPRRWQPVHYTDTKFLQFCNRCDGYKAPRTHHCRRCDRCVKKMDHHCPWINHCVGWANQAYFAYFLIFYMLSNLHAAVVLCCGGFRFVYNFYWFQTYRYVGFQQHIRRHFFSLCMCMLSFGLAVGLVLCMMKLLYIQFSGIVKNATEIEQWIVKKAQVRRYTSKLKPFVYPYDLGWCANLGQVFNMGEQLRGGGIDWTVRKGCDQYTLTCEQLAQKIDKRNRTRTYRCIRRATGNWLPFLSQGMMVAVCTPCTDDPRICLEPNDLIQVTRIRDHWLFGEHVLLGDDVAKDRRKGPIRGWFPRRCAVDITETKSEEDLAARGEPAPANAAKTVKHKCVNKQVKRNKRNQD